jgi:putative flippase GtrA
MLTRASMRPETAQKVRYLLSGGVTFTVEYGSFLVFSYGLNLNIYLALTLSFLLALAVGFAINHFWTFQRNDEAVSRRFWAYVALALLNLGFNYLAVPGLGHLGVPHAVGKILAQSCVVIWNYVLMSRLIFRPHPEAGERPLSRAE